MGMNFNSIFFISLFLRKKIFSISYSEVLGGFLLILKDIKDVLPITKFLKLSTVSQYKQLLDLWCSDYPFENRNRFQLNYSLLSLKRGTRLFFRLGNQEDKPVPTLYKIYPSSLWLEREVYDMFGVFFYGHTDLRRILTDYGFESHPLRKDFPLTGFTEVRYDDEKKRVVLEPLVVTQEYRYFDYLSPWE